MECARIPTRFLWRKLLGFQLLLDTLEFSLRRMLETWTDFESNAANTPVKIAYCVHHAKSTSFCGDIYFVDD
jgi:hypothetical protein